MRVEAITTVEACPALEPNWGALVERSSSATIFLTMEWLQPWWRHFRRRGDTLYILVAREGESIVGLAPLYRRRISAYGQVVAGRPSTRSRPWRSGGR